MSRGRVKFHKDGKGVWSQLRDADGGPKETPDRRIFFGRSLIIYKSRMAGRGGRACPGLDDRWRGNVARASPHEALPFPSPRGSGLRRERASRAIRPAGEHFLFLAGAIMFESWRLA